MDKNIKIFQQELEIFREKIREFNLRVEEISADGNCLFRAVSFSLYGTQERHMEIRNQVVNHLVENKQFYQSFIADVDFDVYVYRMRQEGVWGDNLEIQILSEIFKVQIEIYHSDKMPVVIFDNRENIDKIIRLFYRCLCHYDSIIEIDEQNHFKIQELRALIQSQQQKMQQQNQIISRENLKNWKESNLKNIIEYSEKFLERETQKQIEKAKQESEIEQIEQQILKMEAQNCQPQTQQLTLYEQVINLGFPFEIAMAVCFKFQNNPNANIEGVLQYIYTDLIKQPKKLKMNYILNYLLKE